MAQTKTSSYAQYTFAVRAVDDSVPTEIAIEDLKKGDRLMFHPKMAINPNDGKRPLTDTVFSIFGLAEGFSVITVQNYRFFLKRNSIVFVDRSERPKDGALDAPRLRPTRFKGFSID